MTAPRPGSSIDRAMRALQASGPLPRAELARLIEREDDELDGLLRYGLRMGLLVRSNGGDDVSYALGDGVPVEIEARPSEPPANEYTARRGSQHVLKAEAARPDATDRDTPAIISPVGGPMGIGQAAAAAPRQSLGQPTAVLAELRPGPYQPQSGSQAAILLAYLQQHAPHGGEAWLSPADLAASGAKQFTVRASLDTAMKCGAVLSRGKPQRYQCGPNAPVVAGVAPTAEPAAAPAPDTAAAVELAAFLLKQMDGEIERLQNNLRVVRRRREDFAAAMKGRRA
jgi:hypothetical protein